MQKKDKKLERDKQLKRLAIVSLLIFLGVLILVEFGLIQGFDNTINSAIPGLYSSYLGAIVLASIDATSITNVVFFSGLIFLGLILAKRKKYSLAFASSLASAFVMESLLKILVHRVRPINAVDLINDFGFPSGHATMAGVMASFFIFSFKEDIKNKTLRLCLISFCIFLALVVGFGRIYTNVHWTTDVIAGYALGVFNFALFAYYFNLGKK